MHVCVCDRLKQLSSFSQLNQNKAIEREKEIKEKGKTKKSKKKRKEKRGRKWGRKKLKEVRQIKVGYLEIYLVD